MIFDARLYGRLLSRSSLTVVTEGFRSALAPEGLLAGGVYAVDTAELLDAHDSDAGAAARHGIYTGPMGNLWEMFKMGRHEHYWIMLAPNSNRLPRDLITLLRSYSDNYGSERVHFMAPSAWAAGVVRTELELSCLTVRHGVAEEYAVQREISEMTAEEFRSGKFRVLHFSTSDRQRKGTVELIQAWARLERIFLRQAELLCVLDYLAQSALMDTLDDLGIALPKSVRIVQRADLPASAMAKNLAHAHVVCQPSRGEGFGLIPLEALACGVPIVATDVTGHSEYLGQNGLVMAAEIIDTGPLGPIDDLPGSQAPTVSPSDIAVALGAAHGWWPEMQQEALANASEWQKRWAWKVSLAPFVKQLKTT